MSTMEGGRGDGVMRGPNHKRSKQRKKEKKKAWKSLNVFKAGEGKKTIRNSA